MRDGAGRREAFAALVRENGRSLFRAARAILPTDADAEDAVGEAVLRAWKGLDGLRETEKARAWLLKIVVNCAYAQLRRKGEVVSLEDLAWEPAAPEEERHHGLWEAVERLPRERRAVVVLFYYEGLSIEETARALGVPVGTVKSRLGRARAQLRGLLEEGAGHVREL